MYFAFKIVGPNANGMYNWNRSEWGQSLYFKTYNLGTVLLDSVVPLTAHLFFSISSVKRFHKIMLRKTSILDMIGEMGILYYTPEVEVLSTLFKQAAFTILYSFEVGEGFIYMKMDSKLRNVVLKVFQLKKVAKCDYCTGIIKTNVSSPSIY